MKLVSKTLLYYLLISLPLLVVAGIFCYHVIKTELRDGTEESLLKEKIAAGKLLQGARENRKIFLSTDSLSFAMPVAQTENYTFFSDTNIFDSNAEETLKYRMLKSGMTVNGQAYQVVILKTTIEEDELTEGLFTSFALICAFLIVAFFIQNLILSKTLWKPFYHTLEVLHHYGVKDNAPPDFGTSTTMEFRQLNSTLQDMIKKIHTDYHQQKEFTENASHEMQTPLAVIMASSDLLMQSPRLGETEMNHLQTLENTTNKLASLNKALLLLSKIENNQYQQNENVNIKTVILKVLDNYSDFILARNIAVTTNTGKDLNVVMNHTLAEILVTNLIQNAIRHNKDGGMLTVSTTNNTFMVENTGDAPGIPTDELFIRFKKRDGSKDSLGLGLAIVKSIAGIYNIAFEFKYANGRYSFTLTFS